MRIVPLLLALLWATRAHAAPESGPDTASPQSVPDTAPSGPQPPATPTKSATASDAAPSTAPTGPADPVTRDDSAPRTGTAYGSGAETAPAAPIDGLADPRRLDDSPVFGTAEPLASEAVDAGRFEDVENIGSLDLAGLLNADLDRQLGTTTAVSNAPESALRAPSTLTTISAQEIQLSGATDIVDLLRFVPGVQVTHNAAGNTMVALRGTAGLTGNNVIVLLDGTPLNSPIDATVDWDLIPVSALDLDRIEVVRGPVSTIYGANAYTGVINLVTKEIAQGEHSGAARLLGGLDLQKGGLGFGSGRYIHRSERTLFEWYVRGGYDDTNNVGLRRLQPYRGAGTALNLTVETSKRTTLSLGAGGSWGARSSLDQLVIESEQQERGLAFATFSFRAFDLPSVADTVTVWARSRALFIRTDASAYEGFNYTDTNAVRTEIGLDTSYDLHRIVTGRLGIDGVLDWLDAPYVHPRVSGKGHPGMGAYAGLSLTPTPHLDISVSGRLDVTPVMGRPAASFRGSLVYHRALWALRFAGASAFRSPSYVEAAGRFIDPARELILLEGEPRIDAPRNEQMEVGATIAPLSSLHIAPTLYASRLSHLIIQDFDPIVRKTFDNQQQPHWLIGAELEASWRPSDALVLSPSVAYLRFVSYDQNADPPPLVGVPEQNASWKLGCRLHGTFRSERFGYGLGAVVVSPQRYTVFAGIPPQVLDTRVPHTAMLTASGEVQPGRTLPLWLNLNLRSHLPNDVRQSPFTEAATLGTTVMVGLTYRVE